MGELRIPVLLGSVRRNRQSPKVARWIEKALEADDRITSGILGTIGNRDRSDGERRSGVIGEGRSGFGQLHEIMVGLCKIVSLNLFLALDCGFSTGDLKNIFIVLIYLERRNMGFEHIF